LISTSVGSMLSIRQLCSLCCTKGIDSLGLWWESCLLRMLEKGGGRLGSADWPCTTFIITVHTISRSLSWQLWLFIFPGQAKAVTRPWLWLGLAYSGPAWPEAGPCTSLLAFYLYPEDYACIHMQYLFWLTVLSPYLYWLYSLWSHSHSPVLYLLAGSSARFPYAPSNLPVPILLYSEPPTLLLVHDVITPYPYCTLSR
jgi:hypothetical protein